MLIGGTKMTYADGLCERAAENKTFAVLEEVLKFVDMGPGDLILIFVTPHSQTTDLKELGQPFQGYCLCF